MMLYHLFCNHRLLHIFQRLPFKILAVFPPSWAGVGGFLQNAEVPS